MQESLPQPRQALFCRDSKYLGPLSEGAVGVSRLGECPANQGDTPSDLAPLGHLPQWGRQDFTDAFGIGGRFMNRPYDVMESRKSNLHHASRADGVEAVP